MSLSIPRSRLGNATEHFRSVSQYLNPVRRTRSRPAAAPMHRCLLVSEIFCLVLNFIQQYDDSFEEREYGRDNVLAKRTLASVARTCRMFSAPALDLLWMRLDSLDPLIKVLPRRLWAKKHSRFVVRILMNDKHWVTFQKYAVRIQFLCGPCRDIPPSIQRNVITALARFPKASLPLLPNLTEIVWSESDPMSVIDPTVTLIRLFAGPQVTSISLFLVSWPIYISARTTLADLPSLFPNVTSFTAISRASLNDHSRDIGNIVRKWPNLRVLRTCAFSQPIMDELASQQTLNTLNIELNSYVQDTYIDRLPTTIHTFSLEGSNAFHCTRFLQTLQGNPTNFRLHVGLDFTAPSDMDTLFQMLPTRFDTTQLQDLTISSRSPHCQVFMLLSFPLTESLLASLYAFSSLVTLDLDCFCASELDDAAYERMAENWPELRSLKVGVADVSRAKPIASVGAVIALLRSCLHLHALHIVFDGSIPPPPPMIKFEAEGEERVAMGRAPTWDISNQQITQIHVGHSPIGVDIERMMDLSSCLKSVMPRLERIRSTKGPLTKGLYSSPDMFHGAESDGWRTLGRLLLGNDVNVTTLPEVG